MLRSIYMEEDGYFPLILMSYKKQFPIEMGTVVARDSGRGELLLP